MNPVFSIYTKYFIVPILLSDLFHRIETVCFILLELPVSIIWNHEFHPIETNCFNRMNSFYNLNQLSFPVVIPI